MFTRIRFAAALLILLITAGVQAQAQTETPTQITDQIPTSLSYGSGTSGTISAEGDTDSFSFSGSAGDLVFIRVLPISSGLQVSADLIAPDGSTLGSTFNGSLTTRLSVTGGYFLKVTGQQGTGDFAVRLDAQVGISTSLTLGQVTQADFVVDAPPEQFHFQASPNGATHLTVSADDPAFRFSTVVRDSSGKVIAYFGAQTRSAVLTVGAGDAAFDVTLTAADPTLKGMVLIDLETDAIPATEAVTSQAPNGAVPTPGAPTIIITATPPPAGTVYCQISTNGTANIRSAPDTSATILDRLTSERAADVIGMSADGTWYAVQLAAQTGWVSKQVAREVNSCPTLPVINP